MSWIRVRTYLRLGLWNLLRVAIYRLKMQAGYFRWKLPVYEIGTGTIFARRSGASATLGDVSWSTGIRYFGWHVESVSSKPDWFRNPFNRRSATGFARHHWSCIPDFMEEVGDIKAIWEASRFNWILDAVTEYHRTFNTECLQRLDDWLNDWIVSNPPNQGPNWKCGQETAIRLVHLLTAHLLLYPDEPPGDSLEKWITAHCRRILPTMSYAIGQQNNHAVSEAAGLYVAGLFLSHHGRGGREAVRWQRFGRKWLVNRVYKLIERDGTFSQYSINYHRLMVDAVSFAEHCRQRFGGAGFPRHYYERVTAAISWLERFVDPSTGDAPNIGANDGAQLFQLMTTEYRDFRPSVIFSSKVFTRESGVSGDLDTVRHRLLEATRYKSTCWRGCTPAPAEGGFIALGSWGRLQAFFRYPHFRFRPSQADAHHIDIWNDHERVFVDAGTYSYNANLELCDYFPSTRAHNTAEFDCRNQMPRLSRFLFGGWLRSRVSITETLGEIVVASSRYVDNAGAKHERRVEVDRAGMQVHDIVSGNFEKCVIRWRTPHVIERQSAHEFVVLGVRVTINTDGPSSISIEEGYESLHYMNLSPISIITVEVDKPARVSTTFQQSRVA